MDVDDAGEAYRRGVKELGLSKELLGISLAVAASRIYIAGENLAYALVKKANGSSSRDHGKLWRAVRELYERGVLKKDYRPALEMSYRLRVKGDYGRDVGPGAELSKSSVQSQIATLEEFRLEVQRVVCGK